MITVAIPPRKLILPDAAAMNKAAREALHQRLSESFDVIADEVEPRLLQLVHEGKLDEANELWNDMAEKLAIKNFCDPWLEPPPSGSFPPAQGGPYRRALDLHIGSVPNQGFATVCTPYW